MKENVKSSNPLMLKLSIITGCLIILEQIFQWTYFGVLTPLILPILEVGLFLLFLVITIMAIIYAIRNLRHIRKAMLPLGIQVFTFLMVVFFPFTDLVTNYDFKFNLAQREKVVSMIQKGELKPDVSYSGDLIHLPPEYRHLSKGGGDVVVKDKGRAVWFFTFRGVLDNASGFIYMKEGQPSQHIFEGDFHEIIKLKEHWYWCASY